MEKMTYDVTMFKETFENDFTYINGFMRNVRRFAQRPALTCPIQEKTWTYADLNKEVNKLANRMATDGVEKNDVVLYQLLNSKEFIYSFLAPQKLGAINNPINFRLSVGETAFIIDDSKPAVFIYDMEIKDTVQQALAKAEYSPDIIVMVDISGEHNAPEGHHLYMNYVEGQPMEEPPVHPASHIYDETTRLYTSGTTGTPKGVPLNNINDVLTAHDVSMHLQLGPYDKVLNMSPLFHRGGVDLGPKPVLYVGGEVVLLRHFQPRACLEYVEKYDLTFMIGAPAMLKMLYDQQQKMQINLNNVKGIVTMGAPLSRKDCIDYQRTLTPHIFNGYGTSETLWNTLLRPQDLPEMAGTAGRALTDDEVAVVHVYPDKKADPTEVVARDDATVGEVIIRASGKTTYAYFNNEEATKNTFQNGWMYVGDLATWNEQGFVTIVGRKDDMIVSAGENIHPVQVEDVLVQHPKVAEAVLVGVPDDLRGESTAAYIVKADESLTTKELNQHCREHQDMAAYKKPRFYRFVDQLPYTATGKKKHFEVRKMAIEDQKQNRLER